MAIIQSTSYLDSNDLKELGPWDIALVGKILDERGQKAVDFCTVNTAAQSVITFSNGEYQIGDDIANPTKRLNLVKGKKLLMECTTLGVVEILLSIRACLDAKVKEIYLLYLEPGEYSKKDDWEEAVTRKFSLSGNRKFIGVKGFVVELSSYERGRAVFFLGYEGERLDQALEQLDLKPWNKIAIFGVPGFETGWEMNSFENNVATVSTFKEVRFCSASSVLDAYQTLNDIKSTWTHDELPTLVAPLGTKPHSIATAIFLCEQSSFNQSGLIFDHSERRPGRSKDVKEWHLYKVKFDSPNQR